MEIVKTELGIRKPVHEVFQAFINPEITTKFWFTGSTGKLEEGKTIEWKWQMYHITVPVSVKTIETNKTILIEWGEGEQLSTVKWDFQAIHEKLTFLTITNYNFKPKGEVLIAQLKDATKGFTFVLAGLKAWLEHRIQLNIIEDAFPKEMREK